MRSIERNPIRLGDNRIEAEAGRYWISSPLVEAEPDGSGIDSQHVGVDVSRSGTPTVRMFTTAKNQEQNITVGSTALLSPETARELGETLLAAAEHAQTVEGDDRDE